MHLLREGLSDWFLRTPSIRRPLTKLWRLQWRMQRATPASVVLVVRSSDGKVLVISDAAGLSQLPRKQLDCWITIPDQVQDWVGDLITQPAAIFLVSVEGICGDVTFLYRVTVDAPPVVSQATARWLAPDAAAVSLKPDEARLVRLCMGETS